MSLNFTRRSFFRAIATALATVACVGLLAGCGSDSNKPTHDGDGTITNLNVDAKVTQDSDNPFKFTVEIENGRDNDIQIGSDSFSIMLTDDDDNDTYYKVTVDPEVWELAKNKKVTVVVTGINTPSGVKDGYTVTLRYRPDSSYKEMYSSWIYEY